MRFDSKNPLKLLLFFLCYHFSTEVDLYVEVTVVKKNFEAIFFMIYQFSHAVCQQTKWSVCCHWLLQTFWMLPSEWINTTLISFCTIIFDCIHNESTKNCVYCKVVSNRLCYTKHIEGRNLCCYFWYHWWMNCNQ